MQSQEKSYFTQERDYSSRLFHALVDLGGEVLQDFFSAKTQTTPPLNRELDVLALYRKLRKCENVEPPTNGWGQKTPSSVDERTEGDDIEDIYQMRNMIFHLRDTELSKTAFSTYMNPLKDAMLKMDLRLRTNGRYVDKLSRKLTDENYIDRKKSRSEVKLNNSALPSAPKGPLEFNVISKTSMIISLKPTKADPGVALKYYSIYRRDDNTSSWINIGSVSPDFNQFLVENLTTDKKYFFRVVASTEKGNSSPLENRKPFTVRNTTVPTANSKNGNQSTFKTKSRSLYDVDTDCNGGEEIVTDTSGRCVYRRKCIHKHIWK